MEIRKEMTEMIDKAWHALNEEISILSKEYARLKNRPKPFETEAEKETREDQISKDRHQKYQEFDSLKADFQKKRDYILGLRKEVETLKAKERKDELAQKLIDKKITEQELLELQALNTLYP